MNRITLTSPDLLVLEFLTWRLRVATSEQMQQALGQGPRGWERRRERLVQQQWIRTRAIVLPVIAVEEPLAICWPRDAVPDCDALSWHVTQRWTTAQARSVQLIWATQHAEAIVGGKSGIARQPLQVVHDLGTAAVFFQRRRRIPDAAERWLCEDLFRVLYPKLAKSKVPDAVILDEDGHVQSAVEFAGGYSATRLRRLFQFCRQRNWPIELW